MFGSVAMKHDHYQVKTKTDHDNQYFRIIDV